jgi:soluble lytic murein transglycosylase-like protein
VIRLPRSFLLLFAAAVFRAAQPLSAEAGPVATSTDFDAEFARAADLLEEGERAKAEEFLEAIRRRTNEPAWSTRAALLLAADDRRRGNAAQAAARLASVSAAPIGLEAYRQLARAEALESAGDIPEATAAAKSAFETEGSFALRLRSGLLLASLLEKQGRSRDALDVLIRASSTAATPGEVAEVAIARIRLANAVRDSVASREAARDLYLNAPGFDTLPSTPVWARKAASAVEPTLTATERGRLGSALVTAGDARRGVAMLGRDKPASWPEAERAANLLSLARGQLALKKRSAAEASAALVPDDGTPASYQARLFRCDLVASHLREGKNPPSADDPRLDPVRRGLEALATPSAPASVRREARERLLRMAADAGRFDEALAYARALTADDSVTTSGFEPLWLLSWETFRARDFPLARSRFEAMAGIYTDVSRARRLTYWRARCLSAEGDEKEAHRLFAGLAAATPPDVYARFAQKRVGGAARVSTEAVRDPSTATAAFARVDELLRLRMFQEASAEARALRPSRGRDLRQAQADFAIGRFLPAAAAVKRALPEIGTAEEGRVPDAWRRLYYPIEEGSFLTERASEFSLDPSVLRGLVRQESVFDAHAKSRAGAMGLTQLMPATAKTLARSVLRSRYRRAFLYDPGVNARLGAAYLRRLLDQFDGSSILALAAYNGGPSRIARVVRENPGLPEDELFESIPLYETRDYVRRVLLYAESYRELYPETGLKSQVAGPASGPS